MSASYEAIFPSLRVVPPASPPPPEWQSPAESAASSAAPSGDNFGRDLMEILNPLQHIPVVATIYRQLTGDKIGPMERIAGDTLYGGMLGLASSVADVAFEKLTGKDFGDTALAILGVGQDKPTALAAAAPTTKSPPSRIADASPAQLIPASATSVAGVPGDSGTPGLSGNITLMEYLNRSGIGLELEPTAAATVTVSALDERNANSLLATLNRNGIGMDLGSAAATAAPIMPQIPGTTAGIAGNDANAAALMVSLNHDNIGSDLGLRAMYAYRKSLALPADTANADATLH